MKITDVRVRKVTEEGKMKAIVSVTFDDEFEIQVTMQDLNKAKMDFAYKVIRSKDQAVCVEGMTRNLFTSKDGKIIRLPAQWFDKIKKLADQDKMQA